MERGRQRRLRDSLEVKTPNSEGARARISDPWTAVLSAGAVSQSNGFLLIIFLSLPPAE